MQKFASLQGVSFAALLAALTPAAAHGQEAPAEPAPSDAVADSSAEDAAGPSQEIIVTGSFISSAMGNTTLPVDVVTTDELERRGNPSLLELVKQIPSSGGVIGESNQTGGALTTASGVATINLRNLGPQRTLVLLNGQRVANFPVANGPVNLANLPQAVIGRIEVLKDGAAATYGSDAIAGVVNFITRKDVDGLELSGSVRYVRDAGTPDLEGSILWGKKFDRGSVLFSAAYQGRGRLRSTDRAWSMRSYLENPDSGYSAANNPSRFAPVIGTAVQPTVRDPGCTTVGAIAGYINNISSCIVRMSGAAYNIVDPTDRWQLYGQVDFELSDDVNFHLEASRARTVAHVRSVPNPVTNGSPSAAVSPFPGSFFVPASNPGLALLRQQFPGAIPDAATGVLFSTANFRPFGLGGTIINGLDVNDTQEQSDNYHISAGFSGNLLGAHFALNATYDQTKYERNTVDYMIYRAALALRGYGNLASNPNACSAAATNNFTTNAGNAALGCYYLNPFSNSFPTNILTGADNPLYNANVANSADLVNWLQQPIRQTSYGKLFAVDLTLDGDLPIELPGGAIGWAAGAQFRKDGYRTDYNDLFDINVNPCTDTPLTGSKVCAAPSGPFALFSNANPVDASRNVLSAYVEFAIPVTDSFQAHVAARFEDYGSTGSTFNPKFDASWKPTDWLTLRGSVGTTFRAPPLAYLDPIAQTKSGQVAGSARSIATVGNPDLEPETAFTYNLGAIVKTGGFRGSIDYWSYNLKDPFTAQPFGTVASTFFPNNTNVNCGNPAFADIQALFTFANNVCSIANLQKITVSYINGAQQRTSGIDFTGEYGLDVGGGELTLGVNGSYTIKYKVEDQFIFTTLVTPAFDAAGKYNNGTGFYSLPKWRVNGFVEYSTGDHNFRIDAHFIDGYTDQRTTPFGASTVIGETPATAVTTPVTQAGKHIKSFTTFDFTYRVKLPEDATLIFNASNIFDRDPPLVRDIVNYDSFTASPLGRTFRLTATKRF